MTDKTIVADCERMFPIYDGMTDFQRKQTEHMREGGATIAKLKNIRFEDIKALILNNLNACSDKMTEAILKYNRDCNAEVLKDALGEVLDIISKTSNRLKVETLGTTNTELPF